VLSSSFCFNGVSCCVLYICLDLLGLCEPKINLPGRYVVFSPFLNILSYLNYRYRCDTKIHIKKQVVTKR
jgi:hypothetical protein